MQNNSRSLQRGWRTALALFFGGITAVAWGAEPGVFNLRLASQPETLDWTLAHTPVETYLLINLMDGLVRIDDQAKLVPALAEKWDISADGLTYTFKLRKGVRWADGKELQASQFVASWKRLLTPSVGASYSYLLDDVVGAADYRAGKIKDFTQVGVRAADAQTLVVRLVRPVAYWIYIPSFWTTFPIREDVIQAHGPRWTDPGKIQTLGPYRLTLAQMDQKYELTPFAQYWGGAPEVKKVVARIVREDSTALTLFDAKELDFMVDLPPLDLVSLRKRTEFRAFPYLKTVYLGMVLDRDPLAQSEIRRALALSLDRVKLPLLLQGEQKAAGGFVPPPLLGSHVEAAFTHQPTQAAALAKKWQLAGKKLTLVLPNLEKSVTVAQWIQSELKRNLGLQVELRPLDNKSYRSRLDQKIDPLFILSWSADYPDPDNFMSLFLSSSGNNRTHFASPEYDRFITQARAERSADRRLEYYKRAEKILLEDQVAIIPLYHEPNLGLVQSRVQGIRVNPLNYLDLRKLKLRD